MTTKKKIAAQVIRLLSGGNPTKDSNLNEKYIMEEVGQVAHKLIKGEYYELKNAFDEPLQHTYIATYTNITVTNDTQRQRNYALLPARPMHLPGGLGIQEVSPYTGKPAIDVPMIPLMPHEISLFRGLNTGMEIFKDSWCWEPDRDRVWFTEMNDETLIDKSITAVEMKLAVIDPAQVGETDELPVCPEMEIDIIREVLALHGYTGKEVQDLVNDDQAAIK